LGLRTSKAYPTSVWFSPWITAVVSPTRLIRIKAKYSTGPGVVRGIVRQSFTLLGVLAKNEPTGVLQLRARVRHCYLWGWQAWKDQRLGFRCGAGR